MIDHTEIERIKKQFEAMIEQMQSPEQVAAMERVSNASESEIRAILDAYYSRSEGQALLLHRQ